MAAASFLEHGMVISDLGLERAAAEEREGNACLSHGEQGTLGQGRSPVATDQNTCETMERTASLLPIV